MAGDWIKMRGTLLTNPKVIRMARVLLENPAFIGWYGRHVTRNDGPKTSVTVNPETAISVVTRVTIGALLPLWFSVNDCAGDDGILPGAGLFELDTMAGVPGIGAALLAVGWIEVLPNEEGIQFSNFHEYNTVGKERSGNAKTNAERQREYRNRHRNENNDNGAVTVTSRRNRRVDKKREDIPHTPNGAEQRFDEFWAAYPKKTGKDAARKAFEKRKPDADLLATMLGVLAAQRNSKDWLKDGGQFVPNPATWLNQGRWQDEVDGGASDGSGDQRSFV